MDLQIEGWKVLVVVGLTFMIIIAFNVVLYFSAIGKSTTGQVNLLRRAAGRVKNPWQAEDDDLKKLSQMVAELKVDREMEQKSGDQK